jgi:hypothetical protein
MLQPPAICPPPPVTKSTTYSDHTPSALLPANVLANVAFPLVVGPGMLYEVPGPGAGKLSLVKYAVGLYVPGPQTTNWGRNADPESARV